MPFHPEGNLRETGVYQDSQLQDLIFFGIDDLANEIPIPAHSPYTPAQVRAVAEAARGLRALQSGLTGSGGAP